jgi:putative transposase
MSNPFRLAHSEYLGFNHYYLTLCTYKRTRLFLDSSLVNLVLSQFLRTAAVERFELPAYCFMPDHLHAVATALAVSSDLERFVRLVKQQTGHLVIAQRNRRLWQASYFDRTLRREEALSGVIAYIIANPVRAGIAVSPADYPHWGSSLYSREEILEFVRDQLIR